MTITVREYQPQDEARMLELIEIYNQYFADIDPWKALKYPKDAQKYYLNHMMVTTRNDDGKFFVAKVSGNIVGFIQGCMHKQTELEIMERGKIVSGDIKEFFVLEEFRSHGIGQLLMQKMEKFFMTKKCQQINLDVFAPNILARDFYQKWGFTERALILVKRLPSI